MSLPLSVVIVTLNESRIIERTVQAVKHITPDIVIADTGSTDDTVELARRAGARVEYLQWQGFGLTKNKATALALNDWILFLDADEIPDEELLKSISSVDFNQSHKVYACSFANFIGTKRMHYGEMHPFVKRRLFNRKFANWNDAPVHEALVLHEKCVVENLPGNILHYSIPDIGVYAQKMTHYATLMARKNFEAGKRSSFFKRLPYPPLLFSYNYFLRLGFLDGWYGMVSAWMHSYYTWLKYNLLHEMWREKTNGHQ